MSPSLKDDSSVLSVDRLDEVNVALFSGTVAAFPAEVEELTPLLEWWWLRTFGHDLPSLEPRPTIAPIRSALNSASRMWFDISNTNPSGFIRVTRQHEDATDLTWTRFLEAFARAAEQSNVSKSIALQLTGAIKELEDNIHDHSEKPTSGIVAFCLQKEVFDVVVVDCGIGVKASLERLPNPRVISDHGEALRAVVRSGVSRYGAGSGHGMGFNRLFLGLADTRARLRFRSGDSLLELDGTTDDRNMPAQQASRAFANGLLISIRIIV